MGRPWVLFGFLWGQGGKSGEGWGGSGEVQGGPAGAVGILHFLEVNLSTVQRNTDVFSAGSFCEAVGCFVITVLFYVSNALLFAKQ